MDILSLFIYPHVSPVASLTQSQRYEICTWRLTANVNHNYSDIISAQRKPNIRMPELQRAVVSLGSAHAYFQTLTHPDSSPLQPTSHKLIHL